MDRTCSGCFIGPGTHAGCSQRAIYVTYYQYTTANIKVKLKTKLNSVIKSEDTEALNYECREVKRHRKTGRFLDAF